MAGSTLNVDFVGRIYELKPGETLEFGRGAMLDIDTNPYLHRRVGRFEFRSDYWFLCNTGSSMHLIILDSVSLSQASIAPGREMALTFSPATIRFRAGPTTYELDVETDIPTSIAISSTNSASGTLTVSGVPLTSSQRILIVALAEATLRDPAGGIQILSSKQVAMRLNWPITKFNRKLDNVCAKLAKSGVTDLHGAPGALASQRRRNLVEFALKSGLVTSDDLELIDEVQPR